MLISFFALGTFLARIVFPELEIDNIALGLLVIAALPWFADLLESAEFPGGWKVAFKNLEDQQNAQEEEIKELQFLMRTFLSEHQLKCLQNMKNGDKYFVNVSDGPVEQTKDDIRRLYDRGLIIRKANKGFRTLFKEGGDINIHFSITELGEEYLELLNSDE